ncbi:hypothetical protein ACHRV5_17565 [Flavobacterium sp. FlaQc-52]|uniref:Uncharacterized protein n=1 Tax=Flavobacterium cupriresistens TaxID=2893885 RepID=A0ABU4RJ23_9FLAO|nr:MULTISPECIES: hypothetical protein [unclassified Flavobacterium]MDX6191908.1 hypothetical protein [Flavobacterium sp. Fl-318]UFH41835.1 hypothetical protein LNP23_18735 [Flavobacterium sp. F-323]
MKKTRNIFIQIDTDRVIKESGSNFKEFNFDLSIPPVNVSESSFICEQGLMAMGDAEKSFCIDTETGETIFFTIVPLRLYSYHKIYFTEFKILNDNNEIITTSSLTDKQVSFDVYIKKANQNSNVAFDLLAVIEFKNVLGETVSLPILIDPVLRANQGN